MDEEKTKLDKSKQNVVFKVIFLAFFIVIIVFSASPLCACIKEPSLISLPFNSLCASAEVGTITRKSCSFIGYVWQPEAEALTHMISE